MLTVEPSDSVIIAVVIVLVSSVPFSYVTLIFPPVKSKLSPWLYCILLGAVISILDILFTTSTLKVFIIVSEILFPSESTYSTL